MQRLTLLVTLAATASAQTVFFADIRKSSLPVIDAQTHALFVADINGDGMADLVLGSRNDDNYLYDRPLVYTNRWRGRFEAGQRQTTPGNQPCGVGDLDGDGDIDLVTTAGAMRNDGQERFVFVQTPWSSFFGPDVRFAVGDVDGDGRIDVCTGRAQGRLWINQGSFAFNDATTQVPSTMTGMPTFADFDGDGDLDLLAFDPSTSVPAALALNDGTGRFALVAATNFPAPTRTVHDVTFADFNGDLRLDVVLVDAARVTLLANQGAGRFVASAIGTSVPSPSVVEAGDVDNDGDFDLLVWGAGLGDVLINSGGSFASRSPGWDPTPGTIVDLVLLDADQDGDLDVVEARAGGFFGMPCQIGWNDGAGRFRPNPPAPIGASTAGEVAALGDLDGDGALDVLLGDQGVRLLRGDGRGGFVDVSLRPLLPIRGAPELGDLDRDGDLDAVLVDRLAFHILINPGDGLLQPTMSLFYPGMGFDARATAGALADFDGNGALDLLVVTRGFEASAIVERDFLYFGDGRGGFSPTPVAMPGPGTRSFHVVAGDIDGDGDIDAITDQTIYVNGGGAVFTLASIPNAEFNGQTRPRLADLDRDGDLDLVCGNGCDWIFCQNRYSAYDSVLWNDGAGNFAGSQRLPGGLAQTMATAVGDIDEDGDLDVVFGNVYLNTPADHLVVNDGNRAFRLGATGLEFPEDSGDTRAVFLADIDFDGDLDLVAIDDTPPDTDYPASRVLVNLVRHLRTPDLARLGLPYRLWLDGALQGGALFLAPLPSHVVTPFGRLGLDLNTLVVAGILGPPSQGRRATAELAMPTNPALLGATLWWQGAVVANNAVRLTNVVADVVGW